jgi:outer membrane protein OmpA-like peptidoglycan-associated protein
MKLLGWILFLVIIAIGLLIYNVRYLPLQDENTRLNNENVMWQNQVKELQDKLNSTVLEPLYSQTFLWDDLFSEPTNFTLTEPAQLIIKEIVPKLNETNHEIIVAGYSDIQTVPNELIKTYPTDRELSFAKAMVVVNYLETQGISKDRLTCIGYGTTKPVDTTNTPEGKSKNRRIEIIVKP